MFLVDSVFRFPFYRDALERKAGNFVAAWKAQSDRQLGSALHRL